MKTEIYPSSISGRISAPGSKSIAQRMAACALLAKGTTTLSEFPNSDDCVASLNAVQQLGGIVTKSNNEVNIQGGFPHAFNAGIRNAKKEIHCGESGLAARMFAPIAALHDSTIEIKGEGTLLKRPMGEAVKILEQLQCDVTSQNGFLPLRIKGPAQGGHIVADGSISSQFISGLLIALPRCNASSKVTVSNAVSTPYLQTTIDVLQRFHVEIKHHQFESFEIAGLQNFQPQSLQIPGDWSGAAFLLVAGALCAENGELTVTNLSKEIAQADARILNVLNIAGVHCIHQNGEVRVRASKIRAFQFDATDCPDLFPPLTALAAFADGVSVVKGISRLVHKESNRAKVLQEEFSKAGIRILLRDDEMKIYPSPVRSTIINAHGDHRIAMAASVLGMAGAKITIKGAECVAKSFPSFFHTIQNAGAKVNIHQKIAV